MRRFLKYVWSVAAFGAFGAVVALVSTGVDATARQDVSRPQPVLHFVGVTAHAWGDLGKSRRRGRGLGRGGERVLCARTLLRGQRLRGG